MTVRQDLPLLPAVRVGKGAHENGTQLQNSVAFPPPPVKTLDWNNIGINVREVNGHIESRYNVKTGIWSEPKLVVDPELKIHGLAPCLNYGQQVYEGMKAFRDPAGNIRIFRPSSHANRIAHSCEFVSIPPVPIAHFIRCVSLAVSMNAEFVPPHDSHAALYIRPLVFGSSAQLNLTLPEEFTFCVYVQPVTALHGQNAVDALILEEFDRAAPKGTGSAKVGGNYSPVLRWALKAKVEGFGITLHLDSKTRSEIEEFSVATFIGVKRSGNEITLVTPDSPSVIKGVTSDSCLALAKEFGWNFEVRQIKYEELPVFAEILAVGTAAVVVPVKSITRRSTSDRFTYPENGVEDGSCFARLFNALTGIQRGTLPDPFGWCTIIEAPESYMAVPK